MDNNNLKKHYYNNWNTFTQKEMFRFSSKWNFNVQLLNIF